LPIVHSLRDYDLVCGNSAMLRDRRPCARPHLKCRLLTATKRIDQRLVGAVVGVSGDILARHLGLGLFRHVPAARRRVIWNPVRGSDPARPARDGDFVFGFLGRLSPEKGAATLLDAAGRLPAGRWRLLLAGADGGEAEALRVRAAGLPVAFAGFVSPEAFLRGVDVLVVPSIWHEPLARVVLEACAAGVPVLGAAAGGIPELIGPDRRDWLFPPGDAAALAGRMAALLRAGRSALPSPEVFRPVLERTRPETVARAYLDLYGEVRADRRARR
jgi:glycosyltransferase involved in cell wall biosynthesis